MEKYKKRYSVILDNMDLNEYKLRPIAAIMYIQDAFARLCATKRIAAFDLFASNQYWIVTEFNINFIDIMPFWSEEIEVEIWISEITKIKIYTDYEIKYKNKTFAKGNALWFIIDKETRRPAKTDILNDKFNICNELTIGEHKKFIMPEPKEKISEIKHKNNLSDLDFNNHVNNKSYINLAEMTASEKFRETYSLQSLNIRFNKETFLDDNLICSTYKTEHPDVYTHIVEKDGMSVCDISTKWKKRIKEKIL